MIKYWQKCTIACCYTSASLLLRFDCVIDSACLNLSLLDFTSQIKAQGSEVVRCGVRVCGRKLLQDCRAQVKNRRARDAFAANTTQPQKLKV